MKIIASSHGKNTQQNEEICIGYSQMVSANDSSINGSWNTNEQNPPSHPSRASSPESSPADEGLSASYFLPA